MAGNKKNSPQRRPEDWFPPTRPTGVPTSTEVDETIAAALAAVDINTNAPITGGGNLDSDLTLGLSGTKAQFNTSLSDGDFLFVGDIGYFIPLVDGSEPPNFITDGAGKLIMVAWSP